MSCQVNTKLNGGNNLFKLEDKVFIKKSQKVGVIKEIEDDKYKVTYFDNEKRKIEWFNLNDLREYKQPLEIKIKYFDKSLAKIEQNGNWIDLRSSERIELKQFERTLIPLGIAMQLPKNYEALLAPRSSTYKNFGIIQTNTPGIIDNEYCGNNDQWMMSVVALRDTIIEVGDRICQFRIQEVMPKVKITEVDVLGNPNRSGFGSTGIK